MKVIKSIHLVRTAAVTVLSLALHIPGFAAPNANLVRPTTSPRNWPIGNFGTAKGTEQVAGGVLTVKVLKTDGTNWHVEATQYGIGLTDAAKYTFTFQASADHPRLLNIYGCVGGADYHGYGLGNEFKLGTTWQTYTTHFVASKTFKGPKNNINLIVGGETGAVRIKDVSLLKAN